MKTKLLVTLGAGALLIGGVGIASAGSNAAADAKAAAEDAAKAARALVHHQAPVAVDAAEAAVAREGRNADYRLLLGQSYVAAGRFVSARTAFADAVALAPGNGKAALNLTLMQIATGDWAGARRTLDEHSAGISVADRGLATALAGDPAGAVAMLTPLVRSPEATPKARQNLALSLALAGQWQASRVVAAVDVSPADLDARMEQWAAFARPHDAGAQVASLLGVTQVADTGLPVTLALGGGTPPMAMAATIAPAPVSVATAAPAAVLPAAAPGFVATRVTFLPRREVVQPLPAGAAKTAGRGAVIAAERLPAKVALGHPAPQGARGDFFVQLGAFPSSAVAKDAWGRAVHRLPALAARGASGMAFSTRGITFYRLSVGGFARGDADALCRRYRTTGGACFVRAGAGDQIASWSRRGVEVASR